ncbi:MAG TPA: carbohydrate kinase [Candidatus Anaerobiospirillum stercoravium]|nr:carbohydrate kinase [Candidatus Anaerobiospirillum stercoravium]
MSLAKLSCVGLGEILWDILPAGPRLGGAPANFAFHAMQLGCESLVVSSVGSDERGDEALKILADNGVKVLAPRSNKQTGYVKATLNERGVPSYDFALDTAYDNIPLTDEVLAAARHTDICCFGSLAQRQENGSSRATIAAFLDAMPQGSIKVFDINLRSNFFNRAVLEAGMKRCTAFKCNDEELPVVLGLFGKDQSLTAAEFYEQVLRAEFGIDTFVYTCGEHGSDVFVKGEHNHEPTPKVEVVDTVGAGDSFTATFIVGLAQGCPIKQAHETAVAVAAYVCGQNGAMPKLPAELKVRLNPQA